MESCKALATSFRTKKQIDSSILTIDQRVNQNLPKCDSWQHGARKIFRVGEGKFIRSNCSCKKSCVPLRANKHPKLKKKPFHYYNFEKKKKKNIIIRIQLKYIIMKKKSGIRKKKRKEKEKILMFIHIRDNITSIKNIGVDTSQIDTFIIQFIWKNVA